MNLQWLLVNGLLAVVSSIGGQQSTPSATCPEYDRVAYSAPRKDWPGSIRVANVFGESPVSPGVAGKDLRWSPHGTASYTLREPDTTKPGPWTTVVEVFGNEARSIHLRIRLTDHLSGGVRAHWLNEQLLWLQMWRGRIVSTDMILNVDTGQFIYEQDANYNSLIVPCSMKRGVPK
jgi:hypothetical protein